MEPRGASNGPRGEMDPAAVKKKLGEGVQLILGLPEVPEMRRGDVAADAFEALKEAVKAARKDESLLDGFSEQDMSKVLDFARRRGLEKRVQSRQAKETLQILIQNAGWHRAAHSDGGLYAGLREFLAEMPEAKARLEAPPQDAPEVAPPAPEPKRTKAEVVEEENAVKRLFITGTAVMQDMRWEFPREFTSSKLDTATDGCRMYYDALNRLHAVCRFPDGQVDVLAAEEVLGELRIEWASVLRFLISMYESGLRNAWRARIEYVGGKLETYSPGFREAAAQREPPWRAAPSGPVAEARALAEAEADDAVPGRPVEGLAAADLDLDEVVAQSRRPSLMLDQYGHFAICNGTREELLFVVQETNEQFRLRTGAVQAFAAQATSVGVEIKRPGLLMSSRLARKVLNHQNFYNVTCTNGAVVCTPVV